MSKREHWESVYGHHAAGEVSWYRPHLDLSLGFLEQAHLARNAAILDVGGGDSTLVDDLLDRGFENVTVLDLSERAIARARERLGPRASRATWIVGDVTSVELPRAHFDFWHDRAVFHFLTDEASRRRYVTAVHHALKADGHVLVATFAPEGPDRCSGLPVIRYTAEGIHGEFGDDFRKVGSAAETHHTPWGSEQAFVYCYCRMPA